MASWAKWVIIAGVSVATAAVLVPKFFLDEKEREDLNLDDHKKKKEKVITKKKLLAIFNDIALGMQHVITQLQEIKSKEELLQSQNKNIDDSNLPDSEEKEKENSNFKVNSILRQQYLEALPSIEEQVYRRHGVNKSEVKATSELYQDNPDFMRITDQLRQLDQSLLGKPLDTTQSTSNVPPWLTVDKLLEILTEMMENMCVAMEEIVTEIQKNKTDIPIPNNKLYDKIMQKYLIKLGFIREEIHNSYNINQELLQNTIAKYQKNELFISKWNELIQIKKLRFEQCGIHLD